jgi:hypothetical protein
VKKNLKKSLTLIHLCCDYYISPIKPLPPSHHSLYSTYAIGFLNKSLPQDIKCHKPFCMQGSQSATQHQTVNTSLWETHKHRGTRSWPWWSTANSKWSLKYFPAKARCTRLYIQHLFSTDKGCLISRKWKKISAIPTSIAFYMLIILTSS